MSDTVFRTQTVEPAAATEAPVAPVDKHVPAGFTKVEPPFTDYESEKGHPYLVDHYELGDLWSHGDMYSEGYVPEVKTINEYLDYAIKNGDLANTTDSVKNELKRIEKMINVRPDQRKTMRIGLVAEYVRFLMKSDYIKKESGRLDRI
jgi:hypothetical protein